jgi:hypothetical protein
MAGKALAANKPRKGSVSRRCLMIKKLFALVMVIGVLGAIAGGCAPADSGAEGDAPATTTPESTDAG